MEFGEWLRYLREQRGLKQYQLANLAGVSNSYICDLEHGRANCPSGPVLSRFAAALNVTVDALLHPYKTAEPQDNSRHISRYRQAILDAVAKGDLPEGLTEEEMLQIEDALKLAEKIAIAQEKYKRR